MKLRDLVNIYPLGLAAMLLLLGACATRAPLPIRQPPPDNPELQQVLAEPDDYRGRAVRWGGTLLTTENRESDTWLTILALPLDDNGKPRDGDLSPGRFIAVIPRFLEPTLYSQERKITVTGTIQGSETRKVGEFPYRYPIVQVEHDFIWPAEPELSDDYRYPRWRYDPWYYDPWYYPYYRPIHPHWY